MRNKSTKEWKELYAGYKKQYNAAKKKIEAKGFEMQESKLSFNEYKFTYRAIKEDNEALVAEGKAKKDKNINRTLIDQQTYEFTQKEAKIRKDAIKNVFNEDLTINDVRLGKYSEEFNKYAGQQYNYARKELNMSGIAAYEWVGQTVFGST